MDIVAQVFLAIAFFLVLKSIEYRGEPLWYPAATVASWVTFIVGLIAWLVL